MSKQERGDKALEFAAKCKAFAENACQQWRDEDSDDELGWPIGEMREIYFTLQVLRNEADSVLQRRKCLW
jgi:hypothetical protein